MKAGKNQFELVIRVRNSGIYRKLRSVRLVQSMLMPAKTLLNLIIPDARDFILKDVKKNGNILEIGVWTGVFTERILKKGRPALCVGVDPWLFSQDLYEVKKEGHEKYAQDAQDERYRQVCAKFTSEIENGRLVIIRRTSEEAFKEEIIQKNDFDLIYIDGNHSYEFVSKDLDLYSTKLSNKGKIILDDYNFEDVASAASDFLATHSDFEGKLLARNQFEIRKYA